MQLPRKVSPLVKVHNDRIDNMKLLENELRIVGLTIGVGLPFFIFLVADVVLGI